MSRLPIIILSLFLFACEDTDKVAKEAVLNNSKIKECLVSQAISSVVDPQNAILYAATADLMTRAIVVKKATVISDCRTIIIGARRDINIFDEMANEYCPKELLELTDEQLVKLDKKALEIIKVASNLKGTITDKAIGSCVDL
jgi:hypothetical protein